MYKLIVIFAFLLQFTTLQGQVDTCFTKQEIVAIYQNKQELLAENERLRNIDLTQQQIIKEYQAKIESDSFQIVLYRETYDELLLVNEHYKKSLRDQTTDKKWYQTRFVAYVGGMTAVLVGAVSISLATK